MSDREKGWEENRSGDLGGSVGVHHGGRGMVAGLGGKLVMLTFSQEAKREMVLGFGL